MTDDADIPVISLDAYRIERGSKYCRHAGKTIDPNDRSLRCADCGAPLDVFDALHEIARDRDAMVYRRREMKRQISELEKRIVELKRVEGNARDRVKRLIKKLPPVSSL